MERETVPKTRPGPKDHAPASPAFILSGESQFQNEFDNQARTDQRKSDCSPGNHEPYYLDHVAHTCQPTGRSMLVIFLNLLKPQRRLASLRACEKIPAVGCIPRNADGISSMWDSVGSVHESLSAAVCRNRRMRIQQIRGRLMIVTAFTSFVSIRVIRGPSFFCPRITRMNANRNPFCGAPHSVQAGLPNSEFRIAQSSGRATWGLITKWGMPVAGVGCIPRNVDVIRSIRGCFP